MQLAFECARLHQQNQRFLFAKRVSFPKKFCHFENKVPYFLTSMAIARACVHVCVCIYACTRQIESREGLAVLKNMLFLPPDDPSAHFCRAYTRNKQDEVRRV